MQERFSDAARQVVALAEDEADRMGHPHAGTEHLLLGLLAEDGTQAAEMLAVAGVTLVAAREKVLEAVGPSGPGPARGQRPWSARAQRALDRAGRFSLQRGGQSVAPEDILAGVLDVEGRAGQVLRGLGVDVTALGVAVKRSRTAGPPAAPPAADGAVAVPHCPQCHVDLSRGLSHRRIPSRTEPAGPEQVVVVTFCPSCGTVLGTSPA